MENEIDETESIQRDQEFDEYIDSEPKIKINGYDFFPSDVLFQMDITAYQEALFEFKQNKKNEILESVEDEYPTPIAFYYRKYKKSSENPNQKLTLLRDCNEHIVYFLFSVAISEYGNYIKDNEQFPLITTSESNQITIKKNDIETDKIGYKILIIKAIIERFSERNINSEISLICSSDTIDFMMKINEIRNKFSHTITLSEEDSEKCLLEYEPLLEDLLTSIANIKNTTTFNCKSGGKKPYSYKVNIIKGHSRDYIIDDLIFNETEYKKINECSPEKNIFIKTSNNSVFNISPWWIYSNDTGKCIIKFYKRKKSNSKYYGIIGETSEEILESNIQ